MSELTENIRQELIDKETRYIYDDDLLNSYIATQIKVLREQRGWTQQRLAEEAGMKQARISVLEDVNYSSWTANVLRRLAKAFDLRLTIKFEEFNTFFKDFEGVKREQLEKRSFEDDPVFKDSSDEGGAAEQGVKPAFAQKPLPLPYPLRVIEGRGNLTPIQPLFKFMHEVPSQSAPLAESLYGKKARAQQSERAEVAEAKDRHLTLAMAVGGIKR